MRTCRFLIVVLVLGMSAMLAALPGVAQASLGGTDNVAHGDADYDTGEGPCAVCHNTSASAATRGWTGGNPAAPGSGGWNDEAITALCYYCHQANNAPAHNVTDTVLYSSNHGKVIANAPDTPSTMGKDNTEITSTTFPYTDNAAGNMQCTSCHNVHKFEARPYNHRADVTALCSDCHNGRDAALFGTANLTNDGTDDYSTHPVGVDIDNTGNTSGDIQATIDARFLYNPKGTDNTWRLGGHNVGFGGSASSPSQGTLECWTCHAVHGGQNDDTTRTVVTTVGRAEDYLAIDNKPSDNTSNLNPLCEGCHTSPQVSSGHVGDTSKTDHPIGNSTNRTDFYPTGVALPSSWTSSVVTGASVMYVTGGDNVAPRCSSCHDAHGGMANTPLLRPTPTNAGDGSGATNGEFCLSCHGGTNVVPTLHHSTKTAMGAANSEVDCGNCHGGSTTSYSMWRAHNGFGDFIAGVDNLASTTATTDTFFTGGAPNSRTYQNICESCHRNYDSDPGSTPSNFHAVVRAPTAWDNNQAFTDLPADIIDGRRYATAEISSHVVSGYKYARGYTDNNSATFNTRLRGGATVTDNTVRWGVTATTYVGPSWANKNILSKYGNSSTPTNPGTSSYLICESCHNLLYNAGVPASAGDLTAGAKANLLMFNYQDDVPGDTAGRTVGDGLCRGCHSTNAINCADFTNPTAAEAYVHYPAAHTAGPNFSYGTLTPYGRTTGTILTTLGGCPEQSTADASNSPTSNASSPFTYPANNQVNCDSCHKPHGGEGAGQTYGRYILQPDTGSVVDYTTPKSSVCVTCHDTETLCN